MKKGKYTKTAIYGALYGARLNTIYKQAGRKLSKRRCKIIINSLHSNCPTGRTVKIYLALS